MRKWLTCFFLCLGLLNAAFSATLTTPQTISINEIIGFNQYPAKVQLLITEALKLTRQNLNYSYGSADPKKGGMDCSGTIYYLLHSVNQTKVPRQSDQIYTWVLAQGKFFAVKTNSFTSTEFDALKPGDLLFWTGTYAVERAVPITHVMLYLGVNQQGRRLMFGASDGRTYQGRQIWGVSIFDFVLPRPESKARFVGYGCVPEISC